MPLPFFSGAFRGGHPRSEQEEKAPPATFGEQMEQHWAQPYELHQDVIEALRQGYLPLALSGSARLLSIDPQPERSFLLHSTVLLRLNRLEEAELILHQYITQFGLSAGVLGHLGRVQMAREHWPYAIELLWQALEFDPNHADALAWWEEVHAAQPGAAGSEAALQKVAELAGAWRAITRLAVLAFRRGEIPRATELWHRAMAAAPPDGPPWALVIEELASLRGLDVALAEYDPVVHGAPAGLSLLSALRSAGRTEEAQALLARHATELADLSTAPLPAADAPSGQPSEGQQQERDG